MNYAFMNIISRNIDFTYLFDWIL